MKDGGWLLWETEGLLGGNTTKVTVLYDASAEDVDWIRPLNGAISAGPFYWSDINPAMFNHVYGMVLSAGCRIWFGIWRPYTQFALRYGALLYDDKIKHVTADPVQSGSGREP